MSDMDENDKALTSLLRVIHSHCSFVSFFPGMLSLVSSLSIDFVMHSTGFFFSFPFVNPMDLGCTQRVFFFFHSIHGHATKQHFEPLHSFAL